MVEKSAKNINLHMLDNPNMEEIPKKDQKLDSSMLKIFNIQRSCVEDGPGIRSTIFLRGCNLKCQWCQNPEGQSLLDEKGLDCNYSIEQILDMVLRDKEYYNSTGGGITLSGGDPFLQNPENLERLLIELKKERIKISVETALFVPWKNIEKLLPYIDLFLVDLKILGDDALHQKYTGQSYKLIHENIKKLIENKANINFRMVMVPGFNDNEKNIQATVDFLKSIKYDSIELLKYYNLWEDKVNKFGLDQELLNISAIESLQSLKYGIDSFQKKGIKVVNDELNSSRKKSLFTDRVLKIQEDIRSAKHGLCIESAKLKTEYYKKHPFRKSNFKKPVHIHRSERLAYLLKNKSIKIYPDELIVGNFTSKRSAGQLWMEYYGSLYILFLYRINRQKPVSFQLSKKDQLYFYTKLFPYWINHSIIKKVVPHPKEFIMAMARNTDLAYGFNNNLAAIAHFIPNYDRILELGTTGLIEEIKKLKKEKPENNQDFYDGAIIGLEALGEWGERHSAELLNLSKEEKNLERRKELEEMAEVCKHVPKYPARTFHEALQSIMFIHIALCQEAYENAISPGRLDQILYPYYKEDLEKGRITYEKAKELLCLFILKMDELVLVNDGDTYLQMGGLFETISTDQAVTFGGVDKDGNDATNDITYMLIDASELQTLSLDTGARVHKNSPEKYIERLAEVYLNGSPLPQLFSDEVYIKSIMKHYDVSIEQARNYAIVGCVEPNASDDHFGNTDCANVNLPMPFLQALKGQDRNLWHYNLGAHLSNLFLGYFDWMLNMKPVSKVIAKIQKLRRIKRGDFIANPPKNMDELLERYQIRLNRLTKSVLNEHQQIEKQLRENFTTPLSSSLYRGCLDSGKDAYEGGCTINSSGIQPVGVTDVADSLYAINEVVYKKKLYSINEIINAIHDNFQQPKYKKIRKALKAVPKFGDDSSPEATEWVNKVMDMWNKALDSVKGCPRNGRYSAGYYALNLCNRYGKNTPALPSGRSAGKPLANSITPHYGMKHTDLLSALNSVSKTDFVEHAENGTTATFHIDAALFPGEKGVKNLAHIFKTYLMNGGMQLQPNVVNREILLEAYKDPKKHPYLLVRIAGYCAYFNELSEEMKRIVINRTCYT